MVPHTYNTSNFVRLANTPLGRCVMEFESKYLWKATTHSVNCLQERLKGKWLIVKSSKNCITYGTWHTFEAYLHELCSRPVLINSTFACLCVEGGKGEPGNNEGWKVTGGGRRESEDGIPKVAGARIRRNH